MMHEDFTEGTFTYTVEPLFDGQEIAGEAFEIRHAELVADITPETLDVPGTLGYGTPPVEIPPVLTKVAFIDIALDHGASYTGAYKAFNYLANRTIIDRDGVDDSTRRRWFGGPYPGSLEIEFVVGPENQAHPTIAGMDGIVTETLRLAVARTQDYIEHISGTVDSPETQGMREMLGREALSNAVDIYRCVSGDCSCQTVEVTYPLHGLPEVDSDE